MRPSLPDDPELIAALRAGDERLFGALVDAYSPAMLRVARAYVPTQAVAEEVVGDEALFGSAVAAERCA